MDIALTAPVIYAPFPVWLALFGPLFAAQDHLFIRSLLLRQKTGPFRCRQRQGVGIRWLWAPSSARSSATAETHRRPIEGIWKDISFVRRTLSGI